LTEWQKIDTYVGFSSLLFLLMLVLIYPGNKKSTPERAF